MNIGRYIILLLFLPLSCTNPGTIPTKEAIGELHLKQGALISCGPPEKEFGRVEFEISSTKEAVAFNQGVALLHSFEYDEAEKVFAGIISRDPGCAMAYWGVAMSNFHPLWAPPSGRELAKGERALAIAAGIGGTTQRERDYISALGVFYGSWQTVDHARRTARFEARMLRLYATYPDDKEAAIFYALAMTAAADPADKTRMKQRKAGVILLGLYPGNPDHPGIIHYIIHAYDYPELAEDALPAARRYAAVAPSSAHAVHMPSHIFTRLGLWDECIQSNMVSVSSAECYAKAAGNKGHWDEELHGMDYLAYAYLQKGKDSLARAEWDELGKMDAVSPANFKVAYAFAAIPARNVLERRDWAAAARLEVRPVSFSWRDFPWQEAIVHFARGMGAAHLAARGSAERWLDSARAEVMELGRIHDRLIVEKDNYKADQVLIQMQTVQAWLATKEVTVGVGRYDTSAAVETGRTMMKSAADLEDRTEKHPVTPCEVIPARELLGDMLFAAGRFGEALTAYAADLTTHPNRFNGLYGAGMAAWKAGDKVRAREYFGKLVAMVDKGCDRPEIRFARTCLKNS